MKSMINLKKGLYFQNELELERALCLLMESGFELQETVEVVHDVEVALAVENERLLTRYSKKKLTFF